MSATSTPLSSVSTSTTARTGLTEPFTVTEFALTTAGVESIWMPQPGLP
jgi:hypothetical protein